MKSIAYKLLYVLSGMFLLMAIAFTLADKTDWRWWLYSFSAFYLALHFDEKKAPQR